ncbi:MAG: late competence development ComFB family protein [Defluviitaleaceae bacterium]|nr:late competence development ComFB family protein [Defluviitaleaceae bacterium]
MSAANPLRNQNLQIQNYMETCVADMLKPVLDGLNACQCDNCVMDILAISLNSLPPKYVVTKKGELYTKISNLQNQFDVDIIAAIAKASVIVSRNPRHDR